MLLLLQERVACCCGGRCVGIGVDSGMRLLWLLLLFESQSFVGRGMSSGKGRVEAGWLAVVAKFCGLEGSRSEVNNSRTRQGAQRLQC